MNDDLGRRYIEVGPFPPDVQRHFSELTPEECVECGAPIRHGYDRYFQRNDKDDGTLEQAAALGDSQLAMALMSLTYDAVCEKCGDKLLRHPVN